MHAVALVTGGSRGIGAATALLAAPRLRWTHAIVWLMGNESSYTTGTLVDVAGGR